MPRRGNRRGESAPNKPSGNRSFIHRGEEARRRVDEEIEKQERRRAQAGKGRVFKFYLKPGETKEFAILDDEPSCYVYEHQLKDPRTGKWSIVKTCPKDYETCPVCEHVGDPSFVMYLTVLDFTEFTDRNGNTHHFSRKLLPVKHSQQKKFLRRLDKEGTLRGAVFEVSRDGPKDAAIGNDIEFVEFMTEEELMNDYINEYTDKDGNKHAENCGEPYKYDDVIEEPDLQELRALVGGEATPGSREQYNESSDDDGWEEDEDEAPWDGEKDEEKEEEEKPRRSRRGESTESKRGPKGKKKSRRKEADDDDDVEDDEQEEKPARSSRRARRSRR